MSNIATLSCQDSPATQTLQAVLLQCLGPGGLAMHDGFIAQPSQQDYSQRWAQTIAQSIEAHAQGNLRPHLLLSGADTGTGKTIGYAVPALAMAAMGYRVAISTNSHQLQRQMITEDGDLPRVASWLVKLGYKQLKFARRVGKQGFISASAIELLLFTLESDANSGVSKAQIEEIVRLREWALLANEGEVSGLIQDARDYFGGEIPCGIKADAICLSGDCDARDFYAYETHLEKAERADVVLVSHQYLASCAMYRKGKASSRGFSILVIDEADLLSVAAEDCFRFSLSVPRLHHLLGSIPGKDAALAAEKIAHLLSVCIDIKTLNNAQAIGLSSINFASREKLDAAIAEVSEALQGVKTKKTMDRKQVEAIKEATIFIKRLTNTQDGDFFAAALSYSPSRKFPSLSLLPVFPGALLRSLWTDKSAERPDSRFDPEVEQVRAQQVQAVLFTSATLGNPGRGLSSVKRFSEIAIALGVPLDNDGRACVDLSMWSQFEPVKFGAVKFNLADPSIESPVVGVDDDNTAVLSDEWLEYALSMIVKAHQAGGRALVLTRSYRDTAAFSEELRKAGIDVIEQVRGMTVTSCIERFKENKRALWISPTSWEGLNLPGLINHLVIPRLPFQAADELVKALLISKGAITKKSIDAILYAKSMNSLKRLLRQGIGRPIRSSKDKATIWIADPRFPLSAKSSLPMEFPTKIRMASNKTYAVLHDVVPRRFDRAVEMASLLLRNGEILKPTLEFGDR